MKAFTGWKDKLTKTLLERLLIEATQNDNQWAIPHHITRDICDRSYNPDDCTNIMKFIWEKLKCKPAKWMAIQKTLMLVENLLKLGSQRCVQHIRDETFKIRLLTDFEYRDKGEEKGHGIRERARMIMNLLQDPEAFEVERQKAVEYSKRFGDGNTGSNISAQHTSKPATTGFGRDDYYYNRDYTRGENRGNRYDPYVPQSQEEKKPVEVQSSWQPPTQTPAAQEPHNHLPPPRQTAPPPIFSAQEAYPKPEEATQPVRQTAPGPIFSASQASAPSTTVASVDIFSAPSVEPINRVPLQQSAPTAQSNDMFANMQTRSTSQQMNSPSTAMQQPQAPQQIPIQAPVQQPVQQAPPQQVDIFSNMQVSLTPAAPAAPVQAPSMTTEPNLANISLTPAPQATQPATKAADSDIFAALTNPSMNNPPAPAMAPQMGMYPPQPGMMQMPYMPQHYQQTIYSTQPTIIIQPNQYPGQIYMPQQMAPGQQMQSGAPVQINHNMAAQPPAPQAAVPQQPKTQSNPQDLEQKMQNFDNLLI